MDNALRPAGQEIQSDLNTLALNESLPCLNVSSILILAGGSYVRVLHYLHQSRDWIG